MNGADLFARMAVRPPFSKMHPTVAQFFKDYLVNEKVVRFGDKYVINTHFPPYPGPAFNNMARNFTRIGGAVERSLFSVTLAVTNRCGYNCWHCYNAGRSQQDVALADLQATAAALQRLGVVHVTLTGGEPLLRNDLEEVVAAFDDSTYLSLNTTGAGLTRARAEALRRNGMFACGVSIDSTDAAVHDRMRGKAGAFDTAVRAVETAAQSGLYPYIVTVATHEFLEPGAFKRFMRFAGDCGAREVHLLEPCATGQLAGNTDALLNRDERQHILGLQEEIAGDDDLPILSSFLYLESGDAFGCGAGLTHLYIDGSGEVCPCNLVPISFGNVVQEPLDGILDRMAEHFDTPRVCCVGKVLAEHIPDGKLPLSPEKSVALCERHLPAEHEVPRFFRIQSEAREGVGTVEIQEAYDQIHSSYDEFWVTEAGGPVADLVGSIPFAGKKSVLEAGCGTGCATAMLAAALGDSGMVTGVDISEGMIAEACSRLETRGIGNVRLVAGDALEALTAGGPFDLVFSSWVLGYIPLAPFFAATSGSLADGGHLAFVVHKENSPREPIEIFGELVAADPSVLKKRVAFDFPRDMAHVRGLLDAVNMTTERLWEGSITFQYDTPEGVLAHLLKSGAGTAFYNAIDAGRREALTKQFTEQLARRHEASQPYEVVHDYVACVAVKCQQPPG